jgi:superfamily II DNA or RNA helicase
VARFTVGDGVVVKTSPELAGVVKRSTEFDGEVEYVVWFGANEERIYPERSLLGEDEVGTATNPADLLAQWQLGDPDRFRSFLTLAKLRTPLADNLYSFVASRTERLPYQFKPILKLLESPYSRILIADEVGLGKTIEAGIVLMELQARATLDHVLIVCPSALTQKWKRELGERFSIDCEILDGTTFRERARDIATQPLEPVRAIASIELLRRGENLDALDEHKPRFDVVIADEAHHFRNSGTSQNMLGDLLASLSETVVFLTATPLNLGRQDFFELMRLLVPEEFSDFETFNYLIEPNQFVNAALRTMRAAWPPDFPEALRRLREVEGTSQGHRFSTSTRYRGLVSRLELARDGHEFTREHSVRAQRDLIELNTLSHVFTRTKKREVQRYFPTRRAKPILVNLTYEERAFYEGVSDWAAEEYAEQGGRGFVTTMFQRQAASCLPAMGRKLQHSVLFGKVTIDPDEQEDYGDAGEPATTSVDLEEKETSALDRLHSSWRDYTGVDSKFERFREALMGLFSDGTEKVLLFSFFRGTIDYLGERLQDLRVEGRAVQVLKLYGPMSRDARNEAVNRFRLAPGPVVLLSSEIGSEGLDFQFCSAMVNYDLPWNPMRVEQRIGRLDRYGQDAEVIQIFNMVVEDTVEDRIFYRLYDRIQIFESSVGDLEAIIGEMGDALRNLQRDVVSRQLTFEEEERRTNQVADAIVRIQQEHEEFDQESRRFLGNDDVFADRFNDIERSRRYVTPHELRNFVERFLVERFPRVSISEGDGQVCELRQAVVGGLVPFLGSYLASDQSRARPTRLFINRLQQYEALRATFDPEAALRDRSLEFFSLHHPLVRAIVAYTEGGASLPTGLLAVTHASAAPGPRCFFLFELKATGMKDRLEFVPVVVDSHGMVDEGLGRDFPLLVDEARALESDAPILSEAEIGAMEVVAQRWIAADVARREQELTQLNDETVDQQQESLRLSVDRRVGWLKEQLETVSDERILRMRRSQLSNVEQDAQMRMVRLEGGRGVTVGRTLVAAGAMLVSAGEERNAGIAASIQRPEADHD